jgi:hypothetical protein
LASARRTHTLLAPHLSQPDFIRMSNYCGFLQRAIASSITRRFEGGMSDMYTRANEIGGRALSRR